MLLTISDAVKEYASGVLLDLEVIPGTRTIKVPSGYNPWRKRIEVRLSETAKKGKANQQLIQKLSDITGIRAADITLVAGHTSHRKTVFIKGIHVEELLDILNQLLLKE